MKLLPTKKKKKKETNINVLCNELEIVCKASIKKRKLFNAHRRHTVTNWKGNADFLFHSPFPIEIYEY